MKNTAYVIMMVVCGVVVIVSLLIGALTNNSSIVLIGCTIGMVGLGLSAWGLIRSNPPKDHGSH